jgi:endonuclease/exonuclease/phosphatase family metal-dependent hydrolase
MDPNQMRNWKVLTWNVRGINSSWKWDAVRNKVAEAHCDIACLQETKKELFDSAFLKKYYLLPLMNLISYLRMVPRVGY